MSLLFVLLAYEVAQPLHFFVAHCCSVAVSLSLFPGEREPFAQRRQRRLAAHAEFGAVGNEAGLLPLGMLSGEVATHRQQNLDVSHLIEELTSGDADFAHEHLESLVGGG